jgi:predicted lipid-binding transport protein (Tim44 family)
MNIVLPVPPRNRFVDELGRLTREAQAYFEAIYVRIGGVEAPNNNDLQDLAQYLGSVDERGDVSQVTMALEHLSQAFWQQRDQSALIQRLERRIADLEAQAMPRATTDYGRQVADLEAFTYGA